MSEIKRVYQWQHSNRGVLPYGWWQDCSEADFKARDNKPQFNVRILFETTAVIESLRRDNEALKAENEAQAKRIAHLEYKVDELMLEWCPDEMTPEQLENYAKHQRRVSL